MLDTLYSGNSEAIIHDIERIYKQNNFCVVSFLYFANAMKYHLLEAPVTSLDSEYKNALEDADFLLPDGIALQTWYRFSRRHKPPLHNLNGTDLTPKIFDYLSRKYEIHVYIYSLYDEKIGKGQERLHKGAEKLKQEYGVAQVHSYQTIYAQRGRDFPRDAMEKEVSHDPLVWNIFLNSTWTPTQELFAHQHKDRFVKNRMLVLNTWWFIDFYSGFEIRAPKRVVNARVLETFWRIAHNPAKNFKKIVPMFGVFRVLWKNIFTPFRWIWK